MQSIDLLISSSPALTLFTTSLTALCSSFLSFVQKESHSISNWSASSLGDSSDEDDDDDLNQKDRNTVHWVERFRCFLDTIELMSSSSSNTKNNRSCDLKVGSGMETKIRSFYFESQHDSKVFVSVLQKMQTMQRERAARMATAYISEHLSNRIEPSSSSINLLIEIVSARNLPVADVFTSDPYCLVREGDRELHRTETIDNTYVCMHVLSVSFSLTHTHTHTNTPKHRF